MHRRSVLRGLLAVAVLALGIVACVDVPDSMRAQFAPAGPNDRTNYAPNRHGSAPPNTPPPMLPWDAGTPTVDAAAPTTDDAGAGPIDGGVV